LITNAGILIFQKTDILVILSHHSFKIVIFQSII